jgi:hypothetical protein
VYSPEIIPTDSIRYSVTFEFDENGAYQRHISDGGRIYYEFIDEGERNPALDYFSPYRMVYAPKTHQFGFLNGEYRVNDRIRILGQFSGSKLDLNTMNQGESKNGGSYTIGIQMDSIEFGPMMMSLEIRDWNRSTEYASMGRENDVRQVRFWNLDSTISKGIQESLIQSEIVESRFQNRTCLTSFSLPIDAYSVLRFQSLISRLIIIGPNSMESI